MKKGEVATILTIATVVFLGVATLASSLFLNRNQKQTLKSKAAEPISQSCGGSCSVPNAYCVTCMNPKEKQSCAADAGVGLVYRCQNGNWKFDPANGIGYPECRTECKPSESATSGQSGSSSGQNQANNAADNGCFKLSADFEVKDDTRGKAFFARVKIASQKGGDVQLEGSGAGPDNHLAGWNSFGGGTYTYDPAWTQSWAGGSQVAAATFDKNRTVNVSYTGYLCSCNPQSQTVNCALTVDGSGKASVSGAGCNCTSGCGSSGSSPTQAPTAAPTTTARISSTPTPIPTAADQNNLCKGKTNGQKITDAAGQCYICVSATAGVIPQKCPAPTQAPTAAPTKPNPTPTLTPVPTKTTTVSSIINLDKVKNLTFNSAETLILDGTLKPLCESDLAQNAINLCKEAVTQEVLNVQINECSKICSIIQK